jgi:hypothetical protein
MLRLLTLCLWPRGRSYKEAATLRDLLTQLEKESRKAQALAAEFSGGKDPRLKLGQRIIHKDHGYR